jgi:hypothetical protein
MAEIPNNPDPKEATEAKLCAYLEGELPPQERGEIEQHLNANPQHRKLLADLAQTREWIRAIPHEPAPAELAEAFQGQIERSMLLDDPRQRKAIFSITRWPQLAMIAALVLLTAGLAVTLVVMLNGPRRHTDVAIVPAAGPSKPADASPGTATKSSATAPSVASAQPAPSIPEAPSMVAVSADHPSEAVLPAGTDSLKPFTPGVDNLTTDAVKTQLAAAGYTLPMDRKTVCLVVSSNSPTQTIEQVQGFLTRHQLVSDAPVGAITLPPVAAQQQSTNDAPAGAASQKPVAAAGDAAPSVAAPGAQARNRDTKPGSASLPIQSPANAATNQSTNNNQSANGTPPPTVAGGAGNDAKNDTPSKANVRRPVIENELSQAAAPMTANSSGNFLCVVRGLTPLQLALLDASLEANNPTVQQLTLSAGTKDDSQAFGTAPTGVIVKGQKLSVTVAELVGPGIEKTNVVKVADDGTIGLPMIDPVPAAGVSPGELQQRIAGRYREANLIPQATVTVNAPPSTHPTTMPVLEAGKSLSPIKQSGFPMAATQAVDDSVNVVVLIEKPSGAPAGTGR